MPSVCAFQGSEEYAISWERREDSVARKGIPDPGKKSCGGKRAKAGKDDEHLEGSLASLFEVSERARKARAKRPARFLRSIGRRCLKKVANAEENARRK